MHCICFSIADEHPVKPSAPAIGKNSKGEFCTARLKEYPDKFCAALARAFADQVRASVHKGQIVRIASWDQLLPVSLSGIIYSKVTNRLQLY